MTPLTLNWVSNAVVLAVIVGDVVLARTRTGPGTARVRTTKARSLSDRACIEACSELAETVGFEPTEGLRLHDLSRVAH